MSGVTRALLVAAVVLAGSCWFLVALNLVGVRRARRATVRGIPRYLSEPPAGEDPGVVSVLAGHGRPDRSAVAATVLALAHQGTIALEERGDRVVVTLPADISPQGEDEWPVLYGLRELAPDGRRVDGPPLWRRPRRVWRIYRKDAVRRAKKRGLVTPLFPLPRWIGALEGSAFVAALLAGVPGGALVGVAIAVYLAGSSLGTAAGHGLTESGERERARWQAFARYIADHGELGDVGPEGVSVWGPYLVYGAALGQAPAAARALAP